MNTQTSLFAEASRLEEKGEAFAIAFIIDAVGSVPRNSARMLIRLDGSSMGTIGGGPMEALVLQEAAEALSAGESRTVRRRLTPSGEAAAGMECGGTMEVRIDVTAAAPRLLLVGGGHVNLAIARCAAPLGFSVEVAESRRDFCNAERFPMARKLWWDDDLLNALEEACPDSNTWTVIATHNDDMRALLLLAKKQCAYLGMLGSKRKVAVAVKKLIDSGADQQAIDQLRAPIGLDIGAQTPEEIAISVCAEILKVQNGRGGLPLQGMSKDLVVIRGGGDLASGTAWRLRRCGFKIVILESAQPTVIRRSVSFAAAIREKDVDVEGIRARMAANVTELYAILEEGDIPVLVDPEAASLKTLKPAVLVDAIMAKKNLGTRRNMAPSVVALGPGFTAGEGGDCHAVIETARGHALGSVILSGTAAANTGTPGLVGGKGAERVLRAPSKGLFRAAASIGSLVETGDLVAAVEGAEESTEIRAPFAGKIRGLLNDGLQVSKGFKVGDIDPRGAEVDENRISDKARAVAGAVLEAILLLRNPL